MCSMAGGLLPARHRSDKWCGTADGTIRQEAPKAAQESGVANPLPLWFTPCNGRLAFVRVLGRTIPCWWEQDRGALATFPRARNAGDAVRGRAGCLIASRALRIACLIGVAGILASCSGTGPSSPKFSEAEYGKSSPRVVAGNRRVPDGGGRYMVGEPYRVAGKTYIPRDNPEGYTATGYASWYGYNFHGRKTANGEVYDMRDLTAAHPTLPLPSYVRVTNLANGRSVVVRVNDRGSVHPQPRHRRLLAGRLHARLQAGRDGEGAGRIHRPRPPRRQGRRHADGVLPRPGRHAAADHGRLQRCPICRSRGPSLREPRRVPRSTSASPTRVWPSGRSRARRPFRSARAADPQGRLRVVLRRPNRSLTASRRRRPRPPRWQPAMPSPRSTTPAGSTLRPTIQLGTFSDPANASAYRRTVSPATVRSSSPKIPATAKRFASSGSGRSTRSRCSPPLGKLGLSGAFVVSPSN